jgi:predicted Zn finger-like uncharacterized protein
MSQLVACPECKKHLQVPDELIGKKVQCPECKHTFTARSPDEEVQERMSKAPSTPPPSKTAEWDKKSSSAGKKKKTRGDDDDDDVADDEDDDDDDDRPRRRSKRRRSASSRGNYAPHRGGMILAFGLIGLIGGFVLPVVPIVFAIIAWVMGNADLAEIRAGRMDPEGEGMTQAGRIMGMIAVILFIVSIFAVCGFFGCIFTFGVIGAANQRPQPRRF